MTSFQELEVSGFETMLQGEFAPLIIDVRSPLEYKRDQIPGAINLPVLDNDKRHQVGHEYVQGSAFAARRQGAALIARAIAEHLESAPELRDASRPILTCCARGGQRSSSFAHILAEIGYDSYRLTGGHKAFRTHVRERLLETPTGSAYTVHGPSGCDKTRLLPQVAKNLNWTWLDLEGCADHRGSRFGGIGRSPVTQRQFENNLWSKLPQLAGPVLIEGESQRIGNSFIPKSFWTWMQGGSHCWIELPVDVRAHNLVVDYFGDSPRDCDVQEFTSLLETLRPDLSVTKVDKLIRLLSTGNFEDVACQLLEDYFDPHYRNHLRNNDIISAPTVSDAIESLTQHLQTSALHSA